MAVDAQKAASSPAQADTPLSKEGAAFLRGLISRTEKLGENSGDEEIEAQDVARFRLLSNILKVPGIFERLVYMTQTYCSLKEKALI